MTKQYQTILADAGIRPSIQRIAVYGYLCEHPIHPDVETVYDALNPIYPTLSKTTVYNTLKLFEEKKIIQTIKIEDDKLRFDAEMRDHLHFKCLKCNGIFDVFAGTEVTNLFQNISTMVPDGFSISKIQTNLWGICQSCAKDSGK